MIARWCSFLLAALVACGCGHGSRPAREAGRSRDLPVTVIGDSAESGSLPVARPGGRPVAHVTLVRIAPTRAEIGAALPEPEPAAPAAGEAAPERSTESPAPDDDLRPPLPKSAATLRLHALRPGFVELDVRVDEEGDVTDAIPTGGDADSASVFAATEAALGQRWYPATRRGRPVAVWCRQRYEVGPGR